MADLSILWTLIINKLIMGVNAFRRGNTSNRLRTEVTGLLFVFVFVTVYSAAKSGFDTISSSFYHPYVFQSSEQQVFASIPPGFFFACFSILVTSAITVGLQVLYLAPDLGLLMASPIPPRIIFLSKFLEALSANSMLFMALGAPVLLAFGASLATFSPGYLGIVLLTFLGYSAIATSLGLMVCILVARVVSPARSARTLAVAGGAVIFLLVMASVGTLANLNGISRHGGDLNAALQGKWAIYHAMLQIPPWSWAGDAISKMVLSGDTATSLRHLGKLWLTGLLALGVVTTLAGRVWYAGWTSGLESETRTRKKRSAGNSFAAEQALFFLPAPVRGIVLKEFRVFVRDIRRLSLLVMPLVAIAILASSIRFEGTGALSMMSRGAPLFMIFILVSSLSYRIALSTFASECRAFWVVQSSSAGMIGVLVGKVVFASLVSFAVSVIGLAAFYPISGIEPPDLAIALPFLVLCSTALCGLGVGLSALFVDFNQDVAREAVSVGGRLLSLLIDVIYLGVALMLGVLVYSGADSFGLPETMVWAITMLSVGLVSALFVIPPILIGAGRLSRLEWS